MGLGSGLGLDYSSATLALLGPGLAVASEEAASYSLMRPWSGGLPGWLGPLHR